jgi:hypothetical protein
MGVFELTHLDVGHIAAEVRIVLQEWPGNRMITVPDDNCPG